MLSLSHLCAVSMLPIILQNLLDQVHSLVPLNILTVLFIPISNPPYIWGKITGSGFSGRDRLDFRSNERD